MLHITLTIKCKFNFHVKGICTAQMLPYCSKWFNIYLFSAKKMYKSLILQRRNFINYFVSISLAIVGQHFKMNSLFLYSYLISTPGNFVRLIKEGFFFSSPPILKYLRVIRKPYSVRAEQNACCAVGISAGFPSSSEGAPPPFCFCFLWVFWLCSLLTPLCELAATQNTGRIRKHHCGIQEWVHSQKRGCQGSRRVRVSYLSLKWFSVFKLGLEVLYGLSRF